MRNAAALTLLALLAACITPGGERPPLIVLSDLDNAPFAHLDDAGKPRGRDVEMMEALAKELGRPLAWNRVPFGELFDALELGEGDAICATIGITPERRARFEFTRPYFETGIAVVVLAEPNAPRTPADLAGRKVAASRGTTSERAARAVLGAAELELENKNELPTRARLLAGEVVAAVMDGPAADALVAASGGRIARWPSDLAVERYALALDPDSDSLRRALDAALDELDRRGVLANLDAVHGLRQGSSVR